jgi:hypothetical protein
MTLTVERAPPFEPPIPPSLFTTLLFVILSDARTSVAPERESKDLCTLAFPTLPSGHPHRALCDQTSPACKCQGTCCRLPLFICHPERSAKKRSDRARAEGPLHSRLRTLSSRNSHRALRAPKHLPSTHASHFPRKPSDCCRTLFIRHPERESKDPMRPLYANRCRPHHRGRAAL